MGTYRLKVASLGFGFKAKLARVHGGLRAEVASLGFGFKAKLGVSAMKAHAKVASLGFGFKAKQSQAPQRNPQQVASLGFGFKAKHDEVTIRQRGKVASLGFNSNQADRPMKDFSLADSVDSVSRNIMCMTILCLSGGRRFVSMWVAASLLAAVGSCWTAGAEELITNAAAMDRLAASPVRLEAKMVASSSSSDTWRSRYHTAYRTDVESGRTVEARVAGFANDMPRTVVQCIFFGHDVSSSALKILAIEQAEVTQPDETFTFSAVAERSHGASYCSTRRWRQGDSLTGWVVRVIQRGRTVAVQPRCSSAAEEVAGNGAQFQRMMHAFAGPASSSAVGVEPWAAGDPATAAAVDSFLEEDLRLAAWRAAASRSDWKAGRPDAGVLTALRGGGERYQAMQEKAEAMLTDARGAVERKYLRAAIDLLTAADEANVRAMNEALLNLPRR